MINTLDDFRAYQLSMTLGEEVWNIVSEWNYFAKETIGKQLVRAADSIAANLSEGLGRYHLKEIKNFGYYSRGSLFETKTWLMKSQNRKLISQERHQHLVDLVDSIGKMVNSYINSLGSFDEAIPKPQAPSPKP